MFTATTYIVVSICVAILLYFGAKEHHQVREAADIYRYQSVLVWVIFIGIPVWILLGGFVYSTYPPGEPRGIGLFFLATSFVSLTVAYVFLYIYCKRYYIEIDHQCIRVGGFRPQRTIPFSDIRKMELTQGLRGTKELSLFNAHDERVLKAANTLQDFMGLVYLIKIRQRGSGALFRERDSLNWSKWTEHRL